MNIQDSTFNNRILKEIANLRKLQEMDIKSDRISPCLEILRYIRNTELNQGFDEGLVQENEWIENNK
jgi:hypothetical protein